MKCFVVCALLLIGCGDNQRGDIAVDPGPWGSAVGELVALTPDPGLSIGTDGAFTIAVFDDATIPLEGYQVEAAGAQHWIVHAHDVLGAQYGVADALENLGIRYRHPFDTFTPALPVDENTAGALHQPQTRVRGFQLHTLHPIEAYWAMWEPSPSSTDDAHRIINWVIANRGNYLQWVALKDIATDAERYAAWKPFTQELLAYAHQRGIRVGVGVELFGQSNLQLAFDLSEDTTGMIPIAQEVAQRLPFLTTDLPWDVYALSFGEFFSADPDKFIAAVNEVASQLRTLAPGAEMHADVHVGATQIVQYMGQSILYYFLVQFADPTIVPDIHTTMFYDLFEPTDGAYHHTDFSEHRQYLENRMCANQKAAYFPEDAYWVAFDNSIPQLLPLYVRNRWFDLDQLQATGCPLDEHLVFSSGWEWSYWMHDVSSLRNSYELSTTDADVVTQQLLPDLGPNAGGFVAHLADDQHTALMDDQLAAYIASRDAAIDLGRAGNIISQPDRITFDDLVASGDTTGFTANVLQPLASYAAALDARQAELDGLNLPESRWGNELRDGLAVDRLRAQFIAAAYQAVVDHLTGGDALGDFARAKSLLNRAQAVVTGRHGDLHDTHGRRILDRAPNQTYYQYGYLRNADTLCFWNRELLQVGAILGNTTDTPLNCLF